MENFKNIHIGGFISIRIKETETDISRICNFFKLSILEIEKMLDQKSLDSDILLKWSKILEYDFFRLYSQHLILYAPPSSSECKVEVKSAKYISPQFKKNLYTREIIDFILELIRSGEKTEQQIIDDYKIPKTTLYKWKSKYVK
ncbi:transposase [Chryseobacterium sp. c4a]|uniref:transposase n=1 Tax=Chryseobacterium sp. c4a TaxID=1573582 RepID=UPI00135ADBEB|nr:transposase [Chryseobacterium sp. c4a]